MKNAIIMLLWLAASPAFAGETRVYQMDKHGNIQYHKPSLTIRTDRRIIQTDKHGNMLYHKQQYVIRGNLIAPVNAHGDRQYSRPALVTEGEKSAFVSGTS